MNSFLKILDRFYWFGLLGILGSFLNIEFFKYFYLLFLFALISISIKIILIFTSKKEIEEVRNLKLVLQNILMAIGILVINIKYRSNFPSYENYDSDNTYTLPFNGEWTVANGGINKEDSHSWAVCNQRYAYDFYIVKDGKTYSGVRENLSNYYCYGKEIIAPLDGEVVEIKNKYEDTQIDHDGQPNCAASDVRGNFIKIRHSNNEYSLIGHILKDSFNVRVGDKVKRGDYLANCGNSGNTSEPHIHFQVQKGPSFYFSTGLPIKFESVINFELNQPLKYITRNQIVMNKFE